MSITGDSEDKGCHLRSVSASGSDAAMYGIARAAREYNPEEELQVNNQGGSFW